MNIPTTLPYAPGGPFKFNGPNTVLTDAFKTMLLEGRAPIFKHRDVMYFRYDRIDIASYGHGAKAEFWCDGVCLAYIPVPAFHCTDTLTLAGLEGRFRFTLD